MGKQVRQTQRIRPSGTAERYLLSEYGKCRWLWNALVAESKRRHIADPAGTFGYAEQDKFLTSLRNAAAGTVIDNATGINWLAEGSSVAQQQAVGARLREKPAEGVVGPKEQDPGRSAPRLAEVQET